MGVDIFPSNDRVANAFQATAPSSPRIGDIWIDSDAPFNGYDTSVPTGFRNHIINGDMKVWQRGSGAWTDTSSLNMFSADRWQHYSGTTGRTVSRATSGLTGFQYCLRAQRDSGNSSTTILYIGQNLETVNSLPRAGANVTLSFWARAGANYSPTNSALGVQLRSGTGTDQNSFSGFTNQAYPINTTATLTTSWQRFTYTASVPSSVTQLAVTFYSSYPNTAAGAADYFEITGVQLEAGVTTTPFEVRPFGTELALCQRYYWRVTPGVANYVLGMGIAAGTVNGGAWISFPTAMRAAPTAVDCTTTPSDYRCWNASAATINLAAVPAFSSATTVGAFVGISVVSGLVAGNSTALLTGTTGAYLGFGVEL